MADGEEEDDHERQCQELLLKLKRTTESLLARQSVSGIWTTYGALRRIVDDTENILSHRIRSSSATLGSEGSFWGFVQGLKWLCPSLAPMIDKVNRHSGAQKGGASGGGGRGHPEASRAWLTESVQDHSFLPQLDVLVGNKEHLHSFYHDDAFLCHEEHVQAMRVCFRAIELNKPALLTDISPHLLKHGQSSGFSSPAFRRPGFESLVSAGGREGRPVTTVLSGGRNSANGRARLTRTYSGWEKMGNRQPKLDVSYSGQLSRSNLSLTVDPSLGASSLLHQKTLSSPYFVSSLDSPRVLEHLHGDIRDAISNHVGLGPGPPGLGIRSGQADHSNSPDPLHVPDSNFTGPHMPGPLGPQDRTSMLDYVYDVGSAPELNLLTDPEVAVFTGLRRSTVIAPGPMHSGWREGDQGTHTGSDSTACGSVGSSSVSTLSMSQEEMLQTGHSATACDGDQDLPGVATGFEPGPNSTDLRPKSLSDALLYSHSNQDVFVDSGRGVSLSVSGKFDGGPELPVDSQYCQDGGPTRYQTRSRESSISGTTAEILPPVGAAGIDSGYIPQHRHAVSPNTPKVDRAISNVSVALDASSLNSIITCETDYGPDGVLFGFSPREDRVSLRSSSPIPESEENAEKQSSKGDKLLEPGDSPSGSPAGQDVSDLDTTSTVGTRTGLAGYSPDSGARPKMSKVQSELLLATNDPLLSPSPPMPSAALSSSGSSFNFPHMHDRSGENFATSPPLYRGVGMRYAESDADLYCFSPPTSPLMRLSEHGEAGDKRDESLGSTNSVSIPVKLPGGGASGVYIPGRGMSLDRGLPGISALAEAQARVAVPGVSISQGDGIGGGGSPQVARTPDTKTPPSGSTAPGVARRKGHKRWVSDTTVIQVNQQDLFTRSSNTEQFGKAPDAGLYLSSMTKPAEGQSLISYLTSQDFNTCANLEKENAHFHIAEALISAFESMNWNRMMKQVNPAASSSKRSKSLASTSSEEEEVREIRQRIRIRKRDKMMEKSQPSMAAADGPSQATTSYNTSSVVSSTQDVSSLSGASTDGSASETDEQQIDLTMSSSEAQGSLTALRASGLSLSMASLYSEIELQKRNQQLDKHSVTSGSTEEQAANQGSAEAVAISLLRRFSEKQLPKASELRWLVSERDAPQALLPLPASMQAPSEDIENSVLLQSARQPRLRGNHEWAPPRAQIIFSVHLTEKRTVVMKRQNYMCAGCGLKVDPSFMKRYRYCEYLGKYFCQCCHTGETSAIIPGRVLERWDLARYPVSAFSHELLERMWREPLFHVSTINPGLYKRVRALDSIREGRRQLVHLHSLLVVCRRDARIIKELHKLPAHWVSNEDAYSMDDFTQVKSGTMLNIIKSFILLAVAHIDTCPLCQGLGFICEMCNNPRVIFPFQLETVVNCPVCQTCFHRQCFVPGKCPKCIRMEARRKLKRVPLSPESPDSGEITLTFCESDQAIDVDTPERHSVAAIPAEQTAGSVCGSR